MLRCKRLFWSCRTALFNSHIDDHHRWHRPLCGSQRWRRKGKRFWQTYRRTGLGIALRPRKLGARAALPACRQTMGGKSMLGKLTFSQRRVHTVGVGLLLSTVMLCATPVFAQELRHVAEVLKITSRGPVSFGPVTAGPPACSATPPGLGCKFATLSESGTGK